MHKQGAFSKHLDHRGSKSQYLVGLEYRRRHETE